MADLFGLAGYGSSGSDDEGQQAGRDLAAADSSTSEASSSRSFSALSQRRAAFNLASECSACMARIQLTVLPGMMAILLQPG